MRAVLLYALLVGGPVLGLLGILEAGERLVPPRSVGGSWSVELPRGGARCVAATERMVVAQSGARAQVELVPVGIVIPVEVRGDSVAGGGPIRSDACPGARLLLAARISGENALSGMLALVGCPGCAPVPFEAARLPRR